MQKNLDLNPDLKSRIEIFPFALWSQSNKRVTSFGLGPGARISPDENGSKASATLLDETEAQAKMLSRLRPGGIANG
jgi:hypothetical protein